MAIMKFSTPMLNIILLVAFLMPAVVVGQQAPTAGCVKDPDGCSCSLRQLSTECTVFWNDLGAEPGLMFLDGQLRKLRKVAEESPELPVHNEWFEGDGYLVHVRYRPAPSTCSEWKVEYDDGCEYVDLLATISIIRQSDGAVKVIDAEGSCGC